MLTVLGRPSMQAFERHRSLLVGRDRIELGDVLARPLHRVAG